MFPIRTVRRVVAIIIGVFAHGLVFGANAQERPTEKAAEWRAIERVLGREGQVMPGDVLRVAMPRTDLKVTVRGVEVKPDFALTSHAAFRKVGNAVLVRGDLALLDDEVNRVMPRLFEKNFAVTALHSHLNGMSPHLMYMHYMGHGPPAEVARALREALSVTGVSLTDTPAAPAGDLGLDQKQIETIVGRTGRVSGGVLQFAVARSERVTERGLELLPAMGVATVLNFQAGDEGKVAITGDFVLIADEVNRVARTLREHGIDVTALHHHALADNPRLFYLHFWAHDDALKLARGLRAALDQTKSRK